MRKNKYNNGLKKGRTEIMEFAKIFLSGKLRGYEVRPSVPEDRVDSLDIHSRHLASAQKKLRPDSLSIHRKRLEHKQQAQSGQEGEQVVDCGDTAVLEALSSQIQHRGQAPTSRSTASVTLVEVESLTHDNVGLEDEEDLASVDSPEILPCQACRVDSIMLAKQRGVAPIRKSKSTKVRGPSKLRERRGPSQTGAVSAAPSSARMSHLSATSLAAGPASLLARITTHSTVLPQHSAENRYGTSNHAAVSAEAAVRLSWADKILNKITALTHRGTVDRVGVYGNQAAQRHNVSLRHHYTPPPPGAVLRPALVRHSFNANAAIPTPRRNVVEPYSSSSETVSASSLFFGMPLAALMAVGRGGPGCSLIRLSHAAYSALPTMNASSVTWADESHVFQSQKPPLRRVTSAPAVQRAVQPILLQ
ncbi:hypothetical protein CEUSTIGMA_g7943.t1 [Chlamydomonas eustigma]|uniref:Uncharacterized protein n=1 Tax=Chlamydomonas eustigma TaxID=1157962 RepID=A0A250XBQ1_9CHLO|nr:hypothetical protein CEUSTIGMA_g7943.t1 [Chlamydomonas eustigma]|eukprot:GAX80505.1 hypothetical protein CEUSTIGMA_g7943.t1 [Chlamydomonas eustigma]